MENEEVVLMLFRAILLVNSLNIMRIKMEIRFLIEEILLDRKLFPITRAMEV